jgi:hypothetical protein
MDHHHHRKLTPPLLDATEKTTWFGCGEHIPSVLGSVPEEQLCSCSPKVEKEGKEYPPKGPKPTALA